MILLIYGIPPVHGFEPEAMNCTSQNLDYVKFLYKSNIDGINDAVKFYEQSHPNYDMKSLVDYMYNPFLNGISDSAKCLLNLGVNPLTVAQLSPDAQKVFNYNPSRLSEIAPLFVQYVPIPEFGNYVILIISILILGTIILQRSLINNKIIKIKKIGRSFHSTPIGFCLPDRLRIERI